MKEKSAQKTSLRISLRNEHLNAAQNAGGRPRQHLQSLTAWLVRGFDRKAVKRAPKLFERREAASFWASRRTGFNVHQRFSLPKCRAFNGPFCFLFRPNGKGRARAA